MQQVIPTSFLPKGRFEFDLDSRSLPNGNYLLVLQSNQQIKTNKITILR